MTCIAAVIVTHNRAAMLERTIQHVLNSDFDEIHIIDNASTDGTAALLATLTDPRVRITTLPENSGGAGGFHAGVNAARHADWLVLFDDDAWPDAQAIDQFRSQMMGYSNDVAVVAAQVHLPNGQPSEMNKPLINPFWALRNHAWNVMTKGRKGFTATKAQDVDAATFVGFFLRGSVARDFGPPDRDLFLYSDDILYSLGLRQAGWRIVYDPSIQFTHDCETLANGIAYRPLWKNYYTIRNGIKVARVAAGWMAPAAIAYLLALWVKRGLSLPRHERAEYFRYFARAIRHAIAGKTGRGLP